MSAHLIPMGTDLRHKDEHIVDPNSVPSLRPTVGAFFLTAENPLTPEATERVEQTVTIGQEEIRDGMFGVLNLVGDGTYDRIDRKRRNNFKQNALILRFAEINHHDEGHQDRVGYMARGIGEAFPEKIDAKKLKAVVVGAMIHDIAYVEAATEHASKQLRKLTESISNPTKESRKFMREMMKQRLKWALFLKDLEILGMDNLDEVERAWKKSFPDEMKRHHGKKALDPHAPLGKDVIERWFESEDVADIFAEWTPEEKEAAAFAIRDHSNGSDYNPYETPLEAKLVRLADKLDNTHERTTGMLTPETLEDPVSCHRYVPSATEGMEIAIDKSKKELRVRYFVNTDRVQDTMKAYDESFVYGEEEHLVAFDQAYFKSMGLAAEVVYALFAQGDNLHAQDAHLVVEHIFVKTGRKVEKEYEAVGTNVVHSVKEESSPQTAA
jgi:hypothetical protein